MDFWLGVDNLVLWRASITTDIGHFESTSYRRLCGGEYRVVEDMMGGLDDQSDADYQKIRKVRTNK